MKLIAAFSIIALALEPVVSVANGAHAHHHHAVAVAKREAAESKPHIPTLQRRQKRRCPVKTPPKEEEEEEEDETTTSTPKPTSTTKKPDPPKPTATPKPRKCKRILPWKNEFPNALKYWNVPSVCGLYTWSPRCPSNPAGIDCYPMLWGDKSGPIWADSTRNRNNVTRVLSINEPDGIAGQSTMSPEHAATLFHRYLESLADRGVEVGGPAPSNSGRSIPWITQYIKHCPTCWRKTAFASMHFYGTDVARFIKYANDYHAAVKKPIMITEIGCHDFSGRNQQPNYSQVRAFMRGVLDFVDRTDWIIAVGWYGMYHNDLGNVNKHNALMDGSGRPNELGRQFLYS